MQIAFACNTCLRIRQLKPAISANIFFSLGNEKRKLISKRFEAFLLVGFKLIKLLI
jgi:hypothetical protein